MPTGAVRTTRSTNKAVEYLEFSDARSFLDALAVYDSSWVVNPGEKSPWVFRGHGDAQWPLVPSAWRCKGKATLEPLRALLRGQTSALIAAIHANKHWPMQHDPKIDSLGLTAEVRATRVVECLLQTTAEWSALEDFIELVDELGFEVSDTNLDDWRSYVSAFLSPRPDRSRNLSWSPEPTPAFALPQHHGIPTRLLDWTRRPFVAAFFAAWDCIAVTASPDGCPGGPPSALALWAIRAIPDVFSGTLRTVMPRRFGNLFLHAQDGLFTWDYGAPEHFMYHGEWRSVHAVIESDVNPGEFLHLRKLTLPSSQAAALLDMLWAARVSRAHLMPTLDNVVGTLKSRWHR